MNDITIINAATYDEAYRRAMGHYGLTAVQLTSASIKLTQVAENLWEAEVEWQRRDDRCQNMSD